MSNILKKYLYRGVAIFMMAASLGIPSGTFAATTYTYTTVAQASVETLSKSEVLVKIQYLMSLIAELEKQLAALKEQEARIVAAEALAAAQAAASNPFAGKALYTPWTQARAQADAWRNSRPADAATLDVIANAPQAGWFGNWNSNIYGDVKKFVDDAVSKNQVPTLVFYNIPQRDCGSYSAGGSAHADAYWAWVGAAAAAIGNRQAIVILEPDALAGITCLGAEDQVSRLSMLAGAVSALKSYPAIRVYLDAGHAHWIAAGEMGKRLSSAGIAQADGFSLNVSNYIATDDNVAYGTQLSKLVGDKHFVIDTSRNGKGSANGEWCNPAGRAIGRMPSTNTGNSLIDAFLWVKNPGESDGTCNGGPSAGTFWPDMALTLVRNR